MFWHGDFCNNRKPDELQLFRVLHTGKQSSGSSGVDFKDYKRMDSSNR